MALPSSQAIPRGCNVSSPSTWIPPSISSSIAPPGSHSMQQPNQQQQSRHPFHQQAYTIVDPHHGKSHGHQELPISQQLTQNAGGNLIYSSQARNTIATYPQGMGQVGKNV